LVTQLPDRLIAALHAFAALKRGNTLRTFPSKIFPLGDAEKQSRSGSA
jgi:hypothetical protein